MRAITKAKIDHTEMEFRDGKMHLIAVLKDVEYEEVPDEEANGGTP